MSLLHTLKSIVDRPKKRVGRGPGSGKGSHTAGRGQKGYKSRVGSKVPLWFEGGQLPLVKRLPMVRGKRRFNVLNLTAELTLTDLDRLAQKIDVISIEALQLAGLIDKRYKRGKVIATGSVNRAVTIKGLRVTPAAQKAIEQAGGSVEAS